MGGLFREVVRMAVPAGIPMALVFMGIFVFLVLFAACIVLGFLTKEKQLRALLWAGALLLAGVMGAGAYLTAAEDEEIVTAVAEEPAPVPTAAVPAVTEQSGVVLVVDEATIVEKFDALKSEHLAVEDMQSTKAAGRDAAREQSRVVRSLGAIEEALNTRLLAIDAQVQEAGRRFEAREMDNYDMLFWQAKLKTQQYGIIVQAMDEKQKLLENASFLSAEAKAEDLARIDRRRREALTKWKEYQGVLAELSANAEAFHAL